MNVTGPYAGCRGCGCSLLLAGLFLLAAIAGVLAALV
jgi:hypothetical protein